MCIINIAQAINVDKICAVLPQVASERCPDMEEQTQAMANKYGRALLLFSKCHNTYNSSRHFDDAALSTLRKTYISSMLHTYSFSHYNSVRH